MPVKKSSPARKKKAGAGTILARSAHVPGRTRSVDSQKFQAMRRVLLKVVPRRAPGYSDADLVAAVSGLTPPALFPNKGKVGWWMKLVQEDLEARKILVREKSKPIRWHRTR